MLKRTGLKIVLILGLGILAMGATTAADCEIEGGDDCEVLCFGD